MCNNAANTENAGISQELPPSPWENIITGKDARRMQQECVCVCVCDREREREALQPPFSIQCASM